VGVRELAGIGALRRANRRDHRSVLRIDHEAFPPFWRLDAAGLVEALTATPSHHFCVATGARPALFARRASCAYAIWGRAGGRGYLQRLAVRPDRQRRGIATALVADGLRWLQRRGADLVLVNTQEDNLGAVVFYERVGFRREREGLAVLRLELP
jgi:ribosomal protein S18 acetylase RimI-like enzyme